MKRLYFNEIDPYPAQWIRNLAHEGFYGPDVHATVACKSIVDVREDELRSADRVHFFAGMGIWEYAIRLAGLSDVSGIWTGSPPCQPFSVAGKQRGTDDERHLWPEFRRLIEVGRPGLVFGEQVASPAGRTWLSAVQADLEALGYGVTGADLCAAGVGAPHPRPRLFFGAVRLDDSYGQRLAELGVQLRERAKGPRVPETGWPGPSVRLGCREGRALGLRIPGEFGAFSIPVRGVDRGYDRGFWAGPRWLLGRDGGIRPTEPATFPVAHGTSADVGRLRAYGNGIVAPLAAEFIAAFVEAVLEVGDRGQ